MKKDSNLLNQNNIICNFKTYDFGGGITGFLEDNTLKLERTDYKKDGYMRNFQFKTSPVNEINEIKKIIIGDNINSVGDNAFYGKSITELILGNNIEFIGVSAFRECNLRELIIPDSVIQIKRAAFSSNRIMSLKLGRGLSDIEAWAFHNNEIEHFIMGDNIKHIGIEAFANNRINDLLISEKIEFIGLNAFTSNNLDYLKFPDRFIEISEAPFYGNPITKIDIGNNAEIKSYLPEELIEIDTFGNYTGFKDVYYKENFKKGIYIWNSENELWEKFVKF